MITVLCMLLAAAAPSGHLAEMIVRVERAVVTGSQEPLREARADLQEHLDDQAEAAEGMDRYTLAYVNWQLAHLMEEEQEAEAERLQLLQEAQQQLDLLVEQEPGNAEAFALLGSVIGEQIGSSSWKGMKLGPKSGSALKKAASLAPDNPRVALQRGIGHLFTPRLFGGGLTKAERELLRSAELFAAQPAGSPWPNWGQVDVHIWLGQLYAKKRNYASARAQYERVLAVEPEHHWVRDVLLPELEAKAAKKR